MRRLFLIGVCLVLTIGLGACAQSTAEDELSALDGSADPSTADDGGLDADVESDASVDAGDGSLGDAALVLDGASLDAAAEEDAASSSEDARVQDAAEPIDTGVSEPDTGAPEEPDSGMSEPPDAGASPPMMCDLTACTCFLALPCCTAANTCACYILPGFCNLPPIKVTVKP